MTAGARLEHDGVAAGRTSVGWEAVGHRNVYLRGPPQCGSPSSCGAALVPPGECPAAHAGACRAANKELIPDAISASSTLVQEGAQNELPPHCIVAGVFMRPSQMLPQALGPIKGSNLLAYCRHEVWLWPHRPSRQACNHLYHEILQR